MTTIEAKLVHQLAYIEQAPFYGIFLDLQKAYESMDRDRCLHISKVHGVGPNTPWLIKYFWDEAVLVCQVSGYYGEPFSADYGATQGGHLPPCNCNVMVNAIRRE